MWRESAVVTVFLLSTVKFVVAPGVGWGAGLSFGEIVAANVLGAWSGVGVVALLARGWWVRRRRRRGRRTFTRVNRLIVRMKRSRFGFALVVALCPTFLSVPVGTLVALKFYGHRRETVPAIFASLAAWSIVFTGIVQVVGGPAR